MATPVIPYQKVNPLDWRTPIVNPETGAPTDQFIRIWQQMFLNGDNTKGGLDDKAEKSTKIIAGTGLDGGGTLEADRTIDLADTTVTPGTYGDATHTPQITVDQQGRLTAAASVAISGGGGGGGPSGPYRYWMWNNIIHGADGASLSKAGFQDAGGTPIADPTSSWSNYNSYPCTNLFDGSPSSFWSTYGGQADGNGVAVVFDFGSPVTIGFWELTCRNDGFETQTPIQMEWSCSEDGLIWLNVCVVNVWPDLVTTPWTSHPQTVVVPVKST